MRRWKRFLALSGAGSVAARRAALGALLSRATAPEQAFLRALILGDLRQGALTAIVGDAVAKAADVPVAVVRRALMLRGDLGAVASAALGEDGASALAAFRLEVGRPIAPMLASTAPDVDAAWRRPARPRSSGSSTGRGSRSTAPAMSWGSSRGRWTT